MIIWSQWLSDYTICSPVVRQSAQRWPRMPTVTRASSSVNLYVRGQPLKWLLLHDFWPLLDQGVLYQSSLAGQRLKSSPEGLTWHSLHHQICSGEKNPLSRFADGASVRRNMTKNIGCEVQYKSSISTSAAFPVWLNLKPAALYNCWKKGQFRSDHKSFFIILQIHNKRKIL